MSDNYFTYGTRTPNVFRMSSENMALWAKIEDELVLHESDLAPESALLDADPQIDKDFLKYCCKRHWLKRKILSQQQADSRVYATVTPAPMPATSDLFTKADSLLQSAMSQRNAIKGQEQQLIESKEHLDKILYELTKVTEALKDER